MEIYLIKNNRSKIALIHSYFLFYYRATFRQLSDNRVTSRWIKWRTRNIPDESERSLAAKK